MKNLHTKKNTGSNFDWLIQQMSINQKSGHFVEVLYQVCIRLSFRFAMPAGM